MAPSNIWMKAFYSSLSGSAIRTSGSPDLVVAQAAKVATAAEKYVRDVSGPAKPGPVSFEEGPGDDV